jgi:hypothetical protein
MGALDDGDSFLNVHRLLTIFVFVSVLLTSCGRTAAVPRARLDAPQEPLQEDWDRFCRSARVRPGFFILRYPVATPPSVIEGVLANLRSSRFVVDEAQQKIGNATVDQPFFWDGDVTDAVSPTIQSRALGVELPQGATVRCAGTENPFIG